MRKVTTDRQRMSTAWCRGGGLCTGSELERVGRGGERLEFTAATGWEKRAFRRRFCSVERF